MGDKGVDLAVQFEAANAGFIELIEGLTAEQWAAECTGEGWTANVVAHHIAESHQSLANLINTIANCGQVPVITADFVNGLNADHAERAAECRKDETLDLARAGGAQAASMLRTLSEEQLARTAVMPAAGGEVDAATLSEVLLIGHIGMHLESIKAATAAASAG
jgi:hypothetical protein